jgi:hypothetical protein
MDILQEARDINKKPFISHVFSTTEEGKAEILNIVQYATLGVIPVVLLNKVVQRFIPEADSEKSNLEIAVEIFLQLIIMFCGIIIIHRVISYFPTYSGFKYEDLALTNVILTFLIVVLSIQTKLGIKVNILFDRANELWNGPSDDNYNAKKGKRRAVSSHTTSQADYYDNATESNNTIFPPEPIMTTKEPSNGGLSGYMKPNESLNDTYNGPQAANGILGGSFGSFF